MFDICAAARAAHDSRAARDLGGLARRARGRAASRDGSPLQSFSQRRAVRYRASSCSYTKSKQADDEKKTLAKPKQEENKRNKRAEINNEEKNRERSSPGGPAPGRGAAYLFLLRWLGLEELRIQFQHWSHTC